jgi:hypothetical protein
MLRARVSELDYMMQANWLKGEAYRAAKRGVDTGRLGSDSRDGFSVRWYYMLRRWYRRARLVLRNEVLYAPGGAGALAAKRSFAAAPRDARAAKRSRR